MKNNFLKETLINHKKFFSILLIWLLIFSVGLVVRQLQNDTFYSIKIGELITKNGIDMLDHFSFHNIAYTYPHWLYDVFIYVIYLIDGFNSIYISTIILNCILLFIIFKSTNKLTSTYAAPFIITVIIALTMGQGFATARAQLVTYILFALELFFIEMFIKNKHKRYLLGLILISLLICNIHVAVWPFFFILFLPYVGETIVAKILKKIKKKNGFIDFLNRKFDIKDEIPLKGLLITMLLCSLTGLLTPIGWTPYTYLYTTMIGNSQKYIVEHQLSSLKDSILTIIILVEAIILGLISKIKLRDIFLLLGLAIMAVASKRHVGLFAIAMPIALSRTYNSFIDLFHLEIDEIFYKIAKKKLVIVSSFIIVLGIAFLGLKKQLSTDYINEELIPTKATEFIKENIDLKSARIFNEYNFGSYLLFKDIPVFIDSRADLYTKQFSGLKYDIFEDFMNINGSNCEQIFDFYNITHILIYKSRALNNYFSKDKFKILYEDKYYMFYERVL